MPKITIYTTSLCPYCMMARDLLKKKRVGFEEIDVTGGPYVTAVLNGDVDNFADLKASEALRIADEITTDAKVIPTLTSRAMADGTDGVEAFRSTDESLAVTQVARLFG